MEMEEGPGSVPSEMEKEISTGGDPGQLRKGLYSRQVSSAPDLTHHFCHQHSHCLVFPFNSVKLSEILAIMERFIGAKMHPICL